MIPSIEVLIPYRDSPDRRYALEIVTDNLTQHGWEYALGKAPHNEPWNKGKVVWELAQNSPADILIVHDADVICEPGGLRRAVQTLTDGFEWAIPHDKVYRLDKVTSHNFCAPCVWNGSNNPRFEESLVRPSYTGIYGGGITILPREVYLNCPIDPRFEEWGQEDEAWGCALWTLYGIPWRGESKLMHLWHESMPKVTNRWGSEANRRLYQECYHLAHGHPKEMRKVIEEARNIQWQS